MITKINEDFYTISEDFFNNCEWYGDKDTICYIPHFYYDEETDVWFTAQFAKKINEENLYYLLEEF